MAARRSSGSPPQHRGGGGPHSRGERLQKVLAAAGVGSRRHCETLILDGRVQIENRVVTELGVRVDPVRQEIRVDGGLLPKLKRLYFLVNKPPGVVSTNRDPAGRPRVIDLIDSDQRLFPVGRLDRSSEGLILVTNDGDMTNRLTHPRYGIVKTYRVQVAGRPSPEELGKLLRGVRLAEGLARVASLKIKRRRSQSTELEIALDEGRNREIRRLLAKIGHKVLRLKRIAFGPLRLGDLPRGAYRRLTPAELRALQRCARPRPAAGEGQTKGKRKRP
jgi:23S rRNA pseudouridine2605 synthase